MTVKEAGVPGEGGDFTVVRLFLINVFSILGINSRACAVGPAVKVTRYTCLVCHYGCVLYVKGKINRFRQVCPQFQDNDGRTLWIEQEVP